MKKNLIIHINFLDGKFFLDGKRKESLHCWSNLRPKSKSTRWNPLLQLFKENFFFLSVRTVDAFKKNNHFSFSVFHSSQKKKIYIKKNVTFNFSNPTFFELLSRGWEDFEPTLKTDNEPPCINYYIIWFIRVFLIIFFLILFFNIKLIRN